MEYEVYLARQLNSTVGEMRARMSHAEYLIQRAYDQRKAQRRDLEAKKAKAGRRRR